VFAISRQVFIKWKQSRIADLALNRHVYDINTRSRECRLFHASDRQNSRKIKEKRMIRNGAYGVKAAYESSMDGVESSRGCYFNLNYSAVAGCTWQGKACQLVVNHEEGFALYPAGTRGSAGNGASPGSPPTPLWRRSFDKLKMSADDGARLLWLDFGGEDGEIVSNLTTARASGAPRRESGI